MVTIQEAQMLVEILMSSSFSTFIFLCLPSHLYIQYNFFQAKFQQRGKSNLRKDAHFGWNKAI